MRKEAKENESVREKERKKDSVKGRKIPAALTLNTYYTCYAIDKFILYLYRNRIYDVLYVILYLYGLLHTLYLQNFHFTARPQRTWISTKSAGEQNNKKGKDRKKTDILENDGSVNSIQHANWRRYIPFSLPRSID